MEQSPSESVRDSEADRLERLTEIATRLHSNDYDYHDCALAAAHTYETLVAHGYRARIVQGELYTTTAPHWWAEVVHIDDNGDAQLFVVDPVCRTDDFPEPAAYEGRPDDYVPPIDRSECHLVTPMIHHARGELATGFGDEPDIPQRPPLAEEPDPALLAE